MCLHACIFILKSAYATVINVFTCLYIYIKIGVRGYVNKIMLAAIMSLIALLKIYVAIYAEEI